MRTLGQFLCCLIALLISHEVIGQSVEVTGKVVDAQSNELIPFVSIGVIKAGYGTSSNENGEFELKADSLPLELIFSHLNYEKRGIVLYNESEILVKLEPVSKVLDVITIRGKRIKGYIQKLVSKVYNKALKSKDIKYGKAFYRQKSKNDSLYSELYEIFYDAKFSRQGLLEWEVQEGRYAINLHKVSRNQLVNRNFTLLSRLLTTVLPPTDDVIMPIHPELTERYSYEIKEVRKLDNREVAILEFIPLRYLEAPAFEGEVYVDINSYDVLKVKGKIVDDRLKFVKLTKGFWKNYQLDYEIAFKDEDSNLLLDYIRVDQSFDYYVENEFQFPVKTNSWLTFYEYYKPKKNKRLGGRLRFRWSNAAILDQMGYSKEFWEENPIVKRTPIEEEVIAAFESQRAFGTIYLNNQKQIVLEKKDLLEDPFINELRFNFTKTSKKQEKAYLHLDKPFYTSGEDIWYSAYLVDGSSHKSEAESTVLYVELIDPDLNVINHQALKLANGHAKGDIHLPEELTTGKYRLRAYTNWMLNFDPSYFFDKEIAIYNANDMPDGEIRSEQHLSLRFFPEGGDLVAGMVNRVAFKVVDQTGKGISVKGEIFNSVDKSVTNFESKYLGMGSFYILPRWGEGYYAKVKYQGLEKTFPLPEMDSSGFVLKVNNQMPNTIIVTVQASPEHNERNFYLIGQNRGRVYHESKEVITKKGILLEIPKSKLPDGIFQITLFDEGGKPRSERLVFIDHRQEPEVEVFSDKETYESRDAINLNIKITDLDGVPVSGKFSLAITDADQATKRGRENNINSYLLLSSDLKGAVEQPGSYFINRDKRTSLNLDLLMLTHGWRRFAWSSVLENKAPIIRIPPEKDGLTVIGVAIDPSDKTPLAETDLYALFLSSSKSLSASVETDEIGKFQIGGLNYLDSATIFFSRPNKRNKKISNLAVLVIDRQPVSVTSNPTRRTFTDLTVNQNIVAYLENDRKRKSIDLAFNSKVRVLKEITISDSRLSNSSIHGAPDAVIKSGENSYANIFQMIAGQVPGVRVLGKRANADIRIRNSLGSPLVLLDGTQFILPNRNAGGGQGLETLLSIPPEVVDRIEVLKGSSASIYGVNGNNGVIAIFTKKGTTGIDGINHKINNKTVSVNVRGFYPAREFYSPEYEYVEPEHEKPDKRVTLYWDSQIVTDDNGEATICFYNTEETDNIQIDLQGITDFGQPINRLISMGAEIEKP